MARGSRILAFTFPEALVTIGLMLLFAALVGGVYFQGRFLTDRQAQRDSLIQDKLSLATLLPALCQGVRPPEWMGQDQVFQESGTGLTVKYWNAEPDKTLTFEIIDGALRVAAPEGSWSWKSLKPMTVEWWKNSDRVVGLIVHWTEEGEGRSLRLSWGGRPL